MALRFEHNDDGVLTWVEEAAGSDGSQPAVTDTVTDVASASQIVFPPNSISNPSDGVAVFAGGSLTHRATYLGNPVTIPNGSRALLTWDSVFGDDLLDLAVPTKPMVRVAGWYLVCSTFEVSGTDLTIGGLYVPELDLDVDGDDAYQIGQSVVSQAAIRRPKTGITMGYYIPAGGSIQCDVTNYDGVSERNFDHFSYVSRLG